MSNHQLIQGSVFGTLLIVAVGCGSSANAGASGAGGLGAASGGNSAAGGSGTNVGTTGTVATTSSTIGGASAAGGLGNTFGGNTGTGGSTVAAATGVLGQQCSAPGTLGCNGINQKLTLVCGGNNTWQTNQTCNSATQVCDPRPGSTQGTCQEQDALCATAAPGQQVCGQHAEWTCDAWAMKATKVRTCPIGACYDGKCVDATGCSNAPNFVSCSSDCPSMVDPSLVCRSTRFYFGTSPLANNPGSVILHFSIADALTPTQCESVRYVRGDLLATGDHLVAVWASSPWSISPSYYQTACPTQDPSCTGLWANGSFSIHTNDLSAVPANVYFESDPSATSVSCQ